MFRRVTSAELIGREEEMAAIRAATPAAANANGGGGGRTVLVAGDAGIGKTRLIEAACARAMQDGLGAVIGGCVQPARGDKAVDTDYHDLSELVDVPDDHPTSQRAAVVRRRK